MKPPNIHEDVLRHLWSGQYLDSRRLRTVDGQRLVVIEPGVLNRDSGPDFRDGLVSIGGRLYRGDIEFHRSSSDWRAHSHHTDPKYNSVVLHVVFRSSTPEPPTVSSSGRKVPTLVIEPCLVSPLEKILEHAIRDEHLSRVPRLACAGRLGKVDPNEILETVREQALDRMKAKVVVMASRLLEIVEERDRETDDEGEPPPRGFSNIEGWEQLLYEGIMDGLGYSKNRAQFVRLAQAMTVRRARLLSIKNELSVVELEALLFHESGLKLEEHPAKDQDSIIHLHQLRRSRQEILRVSPSAGATPPVLSHADWVFSPTRPSNFPTIRIAAAAELLGRIAYRRFFHAVAGVTLDETLSPAEGLNRLRLLFTIDEDPFWSFHYSFAETSPRAHALLGETRIYEIVINTVLPISSLYATVAGKSVLHERAVHIAAEIPPVEDNMITRRLKKQLLGESKPLASAFEQQGLLQLYEHSCAPGRCRECRIGILSGVAAR
ncbi:MAG TPA: DUF2851 family protein [Bacteroidota bacterium]|nr:DUF2851 family protein [Bacteroidota bacterium]